MIPSPTTQFVERLGLTVGITLCVNMTFMTVAPYFLAIPTEALRLVDQQQTILQSIFMVLVGYLWGNSAGNKSKDNLIETMVKRDQVTGPDSMVVGPGESATATNTDAGTVIERKP